MSASSRACNCLTRTTLVKDTPTTAVIDGGNGMGMVVGHQAMNLAIEKARQYGLGAVAVRNSSHYGVAGYYPLMAVRAGQVGLSFTNAHPSIAPTFGVKPMLGTNPIAVAAPTDEAFPYMFDAATSIAPRGKIEIAARAQKPIPDGWVIGEDGKTVTDSHGMITRMNDGSLALLPVGGVGELMGGHKGYGLATMVEIFSAAFQNGTFLWGLTDTDAEGQAAVLAHRTLFPGDRCRALYTPGRLQAHHRRYDARTAQCTAHARSGAHLHRG